MLQPDQHLDRIARRLDELALWSDRRTLPLEHWRFDGQPIAMGAPWPTREGVRRFEHGAVRVPPNWPLEHTRLELDLGGVGLVRLTYATVGSTAFGLDPNHRRSRLGDREFSITADCVARLPFGVPNRRATLALARLVEVDGDLEELALLLRQIVETGRELGTHDAVLPILAAAQDALRELDWPSATAEVVARLAPGREMSRSGSCLRTSLQRCLDWMPQPGPRSGRHALS